MLLFNVWEVYQTDTSPQIGSRVVVAFRKFSLAVRTDKSSTDSSHQLVVHQSKVSIRCPTELSLLCTCIPAVHT